MTAIKINKKAYFNGLIISIFHTLKLHHYKLVTNSIIVVILISPINNHTATQTTIENSFMHGVQT